MKIQIENSKNNPYICKINNNVDKNTKSNMVVFTNAKGLHWVTESKVFAGRLRTFGYSEISKLVDNNSVFWNEVIDIINETIKTKY